MSAPRSGWPTRAIALLMADPSPENRSGIELISVFVSGATTQAMPIPNSRTAGRMSTMNVDRRDQRRRSIGAACHGAELAGRRANHSSPAAMNSGPAVRNGRAPIRPATLPIRVESSDQADARPAGPTAPRRQGRVAERALEHEAW